MTLVVRPVFAARMMPGCTVAASRVSALSVDCVVKLQASTMLDWGVSWPMRLAII